MDWAAFAALVGSATAITAVIAFWFTRGRAEGEALTKSASTEAISLSAIAKVDLLSAQLAETRVTFARDYASHTDLAAAEMRYTGALDGLRTEIRGVNERLDRIIENFKQYRA